MSDSTNVAKYIIDRISDQLEANGWTQAELASKAELSPMTISDIMKGKTEPSLHAIVRIAEAFGVGIDAFFPPI